MRIYTRNGDSGQTGLRAGRRVSKTDVRVEACGACDELSAALGVAQSQSSFADLSAEVAAVQDSLLHLGAEIAGTGAARDADVRGHVRVEMIEAAIDAWDADLPSLTNFILPGGTPLASALHVARAVCRRAERAVVAAHDVHPLRPWALAYVNRVSDFLFVLARAANHRAGVPDVIWKP